MTSQFESNHLDGDHMLIDREMIDLVWYMLVNGECDVDELPSLRSSALPPPQRFP